MLYSWAVARCERTCRWGTALSLHHTRRQTT